MKLRSKVLLKLAEIYESSAAGKHGMGKIDIQPKYESLLADARCAEGDQRELAEDDLRLAAKEGVITLVPIHKRDTRHFSKVRLSPANERAFYEWIARESPTAQRAKWTALFREAATWTVPERWSATWKAFCERRAENAKHWQAMEPFRVTQMNRGARMLRLTALLLAWNGRRLIPYPSFEMTGESKRLERWQRSLELLLAEASSDGIRSFEEHGLLPMPRVATFHGPLRVWKNGNIAMDANHLADASTLSVEDIERASQIETTATHCLIVENKAPFLELTRLQSGALLVWSSFPNSATVALLKKLHAAHPTLEFFHHGDTDAAGYDILRDLRQQTGIPIQSHHMRYTPNDASVELTSDERARLARLLKDPRMSAEHTDIAALLASGRKGNFEQERHREPPLANWPFFPNLPSG